MAMRQSKRGSSFGAIGSCRALLAGLLAATMIPGCAAGRFRYGDHEEDVHGFVSRDLEQLIADGTAPVQREQIAYDFAAERDEYRLGRNDVLDISMLGHPEIGSRESTPGNRLGITVRKDGNVWLPVIGPVVAEGQTLVEFEASLRKAAARFYVDPQVSVEILKHESQKFFVVGEVRQPGAFPVDGDTTLLEALTLAGGVPETGDLTSGTIMRGGKQLPIDLHGLAKQGDLSRNVFMRAGDVVFIPDNSVQKVFVLGEVKNPGVVKIARTQLTLAEALATTGGPTPARARRELAIIRGGFAQPVVYRIELEKALLLDDQIRLQPGDRIVVAPTGLATASRYMEQFLPFLVGAQAIGLAAQGGANVAGRLAATSAAAQ